MNRLGCGLIRIGRPWGGHSETPSEREAEAFLTVALDEGIEFFDTAPDYNLSERRLGRFLRGLPHSQRSAFTIASKFGITWDGGRSTVDHSYDALARSLDNTLALLPDLSVIQVHKASCAALQSPGVERALQYAARSGVRAFGASVSDLDSFRFAIHSERFTHIQFPLNTANRTLIPLLEEALARNITLVINRPFNMGALLTEGDSASATMVDSFRFVTERVRSSIVLTGTANPVHLRDNIRAFRAAMESS